MREIQRRRRDGRRRLVAVLAVAVLLAALGATIGTTTAAVAQEASGDAPPAARPPLWSGSAAASAISVRFNSDPPLLPLEELIHLEMPYGESSWDSSGSADALVGTLYPGTSGTSGLGLLCEFQEGACPDGFPPPYPFSARASYPTNPDVSTQEGSATAHAAEDYVATEAGVSTLLGPALDQLTAVVTAGQAESVTRHGFSDDGTTLTAHAATMLSDVDLLGGTIHIDSIEALSESRTAGEGATDETNTFHIGGVTVGGQPAEISDKGVLIQDQGGGGDQLASAQQQLNDALSQYGAQIRVLGATSTTDGGSVEGSVRGLAIHFDFEVAGGPSLPPPPEIPGVPIPVPDPNSVYRHYVGTVVLGMADSAAFVSKTGFDLSLGGLGDLGGLGSVGGGASGPSSFGSSLPRGSSSSSPSLSSSSPTADTGGSAVLGSGISLPPAVDSGAPDTSSPRRPTDRQPAVAGPEDAAPQPVAAGSDAFVLGDRAAARLADMYKALGLVVLLGFGLSRIPRLLVQRQA